MIHKIVQFRDLDGHRHSDVKRFNDERHFINWVNVMERKGIKVTEVYPS